jgi:hypothetical protein
VEPFPGMAWSMPWTISLSKPSTGINASIALKSRRFVIS